MIRHAPPIMYALILLWINVYICRELFRVEDTGHRNAMHGFWMAMARLASHHWWSPGWWPYWDAGMPFEYTYAPLVPASTALWSKLAWGFRSAAPSIRCRAAFTYLRRSPVCDGRCGFETSWMELHRGGRLFPLSPTQLVVPDEAFAWGRIGEARRLYLTAVWDEAPHLAALTFLPLVILFLTLALETRKRRYWIAAGAAMCLSCCRMRLG